jgi:hypothetical protein
LGLYRNVEICNWILTAPSSLAGNASLRLTITFNRMDTEALIDIINIYDGIVPSTPYAELSGGIPAPIVIQQPSLSTAVITFTSDGSFVRPGFEATYQWAVDSQGCSRSTLLSKCSNHGRCVNDACLVQFFSLVFSLYQTSDVAPHAPCLYVCT